MTAKTHLQLPPAKPHAHIGLLGGSFDPPHLGHALLALSFLSLEPIDELWIIPCANHASKGSLSDFSHRLAMCQIAFDKIKSASVLDIEHHLKAPSYTIETINYILHERPDLKLFLALGSDLIHSFHQWHQAENIVKKTTVVVFERTSFPITRIPNILGNSHIHQGYALPDTASTLLRSSLAKPHTVSTPLVDRRVLDYIKQHRLYQDER